MLGGLHKQVRSSFSSETVSIAGAIAGGFVSPQIGFPSLRSSFRVLRSSPSVAIGMPAPSAFRMEQIGGPAGGHILALLRELRMPVVTTHFTRY